MPEADGLVGQTLGPCRLEALIGRGGMGRVYKAHHVPLDRPCAVKLVDGGGAGTSAQAVRDQILIEARAAAKLQDPRIVAIYEVGEERGIPFIVMQWVDGESLEARVKRAGRLAPAEALEIIRETASALDAAHKAGIVHRDIKPGNILVDQHGAVKLTDFGIARPAGVAAAPGEQIAGSFHFMAPEQAFGGPPDPRSDLYALGTTWYYALTAQPPYPGSAMDALVRHRDEAVPEIRMLRPEVTERAAELLRRLMAKKPEDRPQNAHALLKEMLSIGMLLDTDTSGSPFKILPAVPRSESPYTPPPAPVAPTAKVPTQMIDPITAKPVGAGAAPPPPVPEAGAPLGSKSSFIMILAAFGVLAFGWQWRRAGPEDWTAGTLFLSLVPALLTFGERTNPWRKLFGALGVLGAAGCWGRACFGGVPVTPGLEAAIAAGVGICALGGATYLGQWGQDRSEADWARGLSPLGAACLLISALLWAAPDNQALGAALAERGRLWWAAFMASGGAWRWGGTAVVFAAMGASVHLRAPVQAAPKDRKLNWNK